MTQRPMVLGYYADWTLLAPAAIDYRPFTHLCHAFAVVHHGGTLRFPDERQSRDLCARARAAGVTTLLSVGGEGSGPAFASQTADADTIARLADRLVKETIRRGYHGVDVDWEFPTNTRESGRMNALVHALRIRLPVGAPLSMAVPAEDWNGRWFDRKSLQSAVDFVNVMTYDFHGSWSDRAGYNAPLYASPNDPDTKSADTVDGSIAYWLNQKNWPPEKLLLGIPLYGQGFRAAHWGGRPTGAFPDSVDLSFNGVEKLIARGWKRHWDATACVPTLRSPDGSQVISYDDTESTQRKAAYAAQVRRLGGVFFWEISNDFNGTTNPLVHAARKGLG